MKIVTLRDEDLKKIDFIVNFLLCREGGFLAGALVSVRSANHPSGLACILVAASNDGKKLFETTKKEPQLAECDFFCIPCSNPCRSRKEAIWASLGVLHMQGLPRALYTAAGPLVGLFRPISR